MTHRPQPSSDSRFPRRTVLVAPSASPELIDALEVTGLDVTIWPALQAAAPDSFASLDEAIENLFGYDWIIFVSENAVTSFLDRIHKLQHEISELDALRVCAITESTLAALEHQQVHVDVVCRQFDVSRVVHDIAAYAGSLEDVSRRTFLIPQAIIGREYLKLALEDTGARADVVAAYRTVSGSDALRLLSLQTILNSRGVDCVIFGQAADVDEFARVFDTPDLSRLLIATEVVCGDEETSKRASEFHLSANIALHQDSPQQIAEAIAARLIR